MRSELKRLSRKGQSEFDHHYACWAVNHRGWSKAKKSNKKIARKRLKRTMKMQEE